MTLWGITKNKWHFLTFEKTKVILRGMNFVRKKISWHSPDCFQKAEFDRIFHK